MSGRRLVTAGALLVVVAGIVLALVTGAFGAFARGSSGGTSSTLPPGALEPSNQATATPSDSGTPSVAAAALPKPVLAPMDSAPAPDGAKLREVIRSVKVKGMGQTYSGAVIDMTSGKLLFDHRAREAYIPASTMKLLTSTAALSILGPEHTFTTSVVAPKKGELILVGGGDPYLAKRTVSGRYPKRSSMAQLAARTVTGLKKHKVKKVQLGYDDSLFTGPAWNPTWPGLYGDQVTPTSALWVDEGRVNGGSPGPRVGNPSRDAAETFAAGLRSRGVAVTVTGGQRARGSATPVASVSSMPLDRIVEKLLLESDNDAAEVLFRQAAIGAGKPGSIKAARSVVSARLAKIGVWDASAEIHDGSGLSRETLVPAETMAGLLYRAGQPKHPELRAVLTGLPVAGVEGSLLRRFDDNESAAGRGVVRGKTGTLRQVHSLAGYLHTRDGSLIAYAFLVNKPANDYASVVWLSHVTAALSDCACRRR